MSPVKRRSAVRNVFLSSTAKDLGPYRDAVFKAISALDGFHCVHMEDFGARDWEADDFCRAKVAECDVFVGLLGHLYGSSPPGSKTSFSEREYEAAVEAGLPCLLFLAADDLPLTPNLREKEALWKRQQRFRDRVRKDRIVAFFNAPDPLATKVIAALHHLEPEKPKTAARAKKTPRTPEPPAGDRPTIFLSYSHQDEAWKDRVVKHLKVLEPQSVLEVWDDRRILGGDDWLTGIQEAMDRAAVAVLLISADSLVSRLILETEVPYLRERQKRDGIRIIPLIVHACAWKAVPWIEATQCRPKNGSPLSGGSAHKADEALAALALEIRTYLGTASKPPRLKSAPTISTSHLPFTSSLVVGRETERAELDAAWDDPATNVFSLVAFGGVGKSSLVNAWLEDLRAEGWRGAERVFGRSFYSQGTEATGASGDSFVNEALWWFGYQGEPISSPWEKGVVLARLVRERRTLLILDGLEPLQHPPGAQTGRIKDPAVAALIRELAVQNHGLCVITTRLAVADVAGKSGAAALDLERLPEKAGAALLRGLGVTGSESELQRASKEFGGHALALTLLGTYLRDVCDGDVRRRREVELGNADAQQGGHAFRILQAYARYLGEGPELAVLRLLGLFDRTTEGELLAALRAKPAIPGLTDWLVDITDKELGWAISNLQQLGLILPTDPHRPAALDTHPLVRAYFREEVEKEHPEAWRKANLRLGEHKSNTKWREMLEEARRLLATGAYLEARRMLSQIPSDQTGSLEGMQAEFGFIFDFSREEETDHRIWRNRQGEVEWRRKVWAVIATEILGSTAGDVLKSEKKDEKDLAEAPHTSVLNETNERKGELLEKDTLQLLRLLFDFEDSEEAILTKARQQTRGAQLGCDIKLGFCRHINNRNVRCLVECKSHEGQIPIRELHAKLWTAKNHHVAIDHWILIAPRGFIGNVEDGDVDRWNLDQDFPFNVQLWTQDTAVRELFGLDPSLYDRWIDPKQGEEHPRHWSEMKRKRIRDKWLRLLDPPLRLPEPWVRYVTAEEGEGLFIENDDRGTLKELWKKDLYIPPRALDSSRTPLARPLMDAVQSWLGEAEARVLLLLGDFGDGKSAFTYMLSRELLSEYRRNPKNGWLPVRFSLRQFSRPRFNAREFLRNRLESFGSSVPEWNMIVEEKRILVILDGMDEMTKALTTVAVRDAVGLLVDCCNHEFERAPKLLITSRTPFFEELGPRTYLEDKLDHPRVLYLEPFLRSQVYGKLKELARTPEERLRLHALNQSYDPLGLAVKGLFFRMVSQTFSDPKSDFSTETATYETFIRNCIFRDRKEELLETVRQDLVKGDLAGRVLDIMEKMAMEIQMGQKEYICLKDMAIADDARDLALQLWNSIEESSEGEDAVHRIGVRSLLHKKSQGVDERDAESWPVDFCHRSVREYFVARGIDRALRGGLLDAIRVLEKVDYNHEIVRFVSEMMRRSNHNYCSVLRDLATLSRRSSGPDTREEARRARLGRISVTLLYKWKGDLPDRDWSHLTLDGAHLAGADLTEKDFKHTSLRFANLNNAILVGADFSGADLTGARLEETGEVFSLAVPPSLDGFYAAYHDGAIRRWNFDSDQEDASRCVYEPTTREARPLRIAALPGEGLCLYSRDSMVFLNADGERYREVSRFKTRADFIYAALKESGVAVVERGHGHGCDLKVFDFSPEGMPTLRERRVDPCTGCDFLGRAIVAILDEGRVVLFPADDEGKTQEIARLVEPSAIAAIGPLEDGGTFFIGCGGRDGTVGLWKVVLGTATAELDCKELFRAKIHEGPATCLCFAGERKLLSGGVDHRIYPIEIDEIGGTAAPGKPFELRLQCKGMKIQDMEGQREGEILQAAGATCE